MRTATCWFSKFRKGGIEVILDFNRFRGSDFGGTHNLGRNYFLSDCFDGLGSGRTGIGLTCGAGGSTGSTWAATLASTATVASAEAVARAFTDFALDLRGTDGDVERVVTVGTVTGGSTGGASTTGGASIEG